jgi:hypothetical protein
MVLILKNLRSFIFDTLSGLAVLVDVHRQTGELEGIQADPAVRKYVEAGHLFLFEEGSRATDDLALESRFFGSDSRLLDSEAFEWSFGDCLLVLHKI